MGEVVLLLFLGINAAVDLKKKEILLLPTLLYSFLCLWILLVSEEDLWILLLSCLPGVCFLGIAILCRGGVGLGDGWILLLMGLQLGFYPVLGILWFSLLLVLVFAVILLLSGKMERKGNLTLPLVPFLFVATVIWEVIVR